MAALNKLLAHETVLQNRVEQELPIGSNNGIQSGTRNQSLEQMIFQGEATTAMAAAQGMKRGSVHNYMKVHHVVRTSTGYETHYRNDCGNPNHSLVHDVWSEKRAKRRARESAQKERIKRRAQERKRKPLQQSAISEAVLTSIVQRHGYDPRAVRDTEAHYESHPLSSFAPENIYHLFQDYWNSSDNGERRTWESLAHTAGLKYGADAASVIKGRNLKPLTREVGYTRRIRVNPEEHTLIGQLHPTPFTITEIRSLLAWPRTYPTMEKLMRKLGPRPWASHSPSSPGRRRIVGSYITAHNVFEIEDRGSDTFQTAAELKMKAGTVATYEKARAVAELQMSELFRIRDDVLGGRSLSDIVDAKV